ncbi:MAG: phospholipase D family protein [Chloroflexi bacterium]|nr:phospholipase D family protein [Chloroflexota bacterium]
MLKPDDRRLLLEALRPPVGYSLDCAVATTYSLDLLALLSAPLAFTFFDAEDAEGRPLANPLALLDAVRRYAGRIHIFCQAGQIKVPGRSQLLYSYLEDSVFEVNAPSPHGVFHPKVWALRFVAPESPVLYRLLCLSRNLTFDRSWDTALVLEGTLVERKNAHGSNHPLGNFFAVLPRLLRRPLPARVLADVDKVQRELRRVQFELPPGYNELSFFPLGIPGAPRWPFEGRIDRMLVISPFLADGCLARLTRSGVGHILVTRPESAETLSGKSLNAFQKVYSLAEASEEESGSEDDEVPGQAPPSGLHAKLYVADAGWDARIWTGSANATDAAFRHNVEFLVGLQGKKSQCGVEATLGLNERTGATLFGLLEEIRPLDSSAVPDPVQERLDEMLRLTQRVIAQAEMIARVVPAARPDEYCLDLTLQENTSVPSLPVGVAGRCWPITLREEQSVALGCMVPTIASFASISCEAITSFFAWELSTSAEGRTARVRFVRNLPLQGEPSQRGERILRAILHDRSQTARYLFLLLAGQDTGRPAGEGIDHIIGRSGLESGSVGTLPALFEALVRALYEEPARIDEVARVVEDLKGSEDSSLLPEGFEEIWLPIAEARRRLSSE